MTTNIIAFAIVLGVLIFIHELGHFLMARFFGVGVEKFSLGFGPKILSKTVGRTDYCLSAIPLGGYVKMVGEEPDAEIDPSDIPISFTHQHVAKRICIVAAGPSFNMILAILIFFCFFQYYGDVELKPVIGMVEEGKPAQLAGLAVNDIIVRINGTSVKTWEQMTELITSNEGGHLSIDVERKGETQVIELQPELTVDKNMFGEEIKRYVIGIRPSGDYLVNELNPLEALVSSVQKTYEITSLTFIVIAKMIKGTVSVKELGGPIMIYQMAGQQAKAGIANLIYFIALISINLAILNFLPIPVLDGGHIMFFSIEAIKGSPVSMKTREIAQQAGLFVLLLLMIFVFYNDITRVLSN
ncbi:MAG: RIP metalloprotease RseP [Proteobacteria bacterium]|nr:RIP metalloprotease RseP [Pseudomonadota bacterium]